MTFDNYSFVLQHTSFFDWLKSSLIVSLGTTVIGVLIAATTGYAVSRMRFPGYRKFMWVLLVTQMFPVAVLIVPMYQILSDLQLIDSYLGLILVYCTDGRAVLRLAAEGLLRHHPVRDRRGRTRRRADPLRHVRAADPAARQAGARGRRVLQLPHRLR